MDTFSKRGTVRKLCSAISGLMGRWVDMEWWLNSLHLHRRLQTVSLQGLTISRLLYMRTLFKWPLFLILSISTFNTMTLWCHTAMVDKVNSFQEQGLISCKRDNHRSQVWSMQLDWSDLTKTWASSWHLPVMIILIILPQTPWSVLYALCTIMSVILLLIFMYIHEYKSYTTSLTYVLCMIYLDLLFICQATSILLIVSSPSSSSSSSISGQPAARWVIPSQELWLKSHLSYINNTSANKRVLSAESLFLYINPKLISVSIGFIRKYDAAHYITLHCLDLVAGYQ